MLAAQLEIERFHMAKHLELAITPSSFSWRRKLELLAATDADLAKIIAATPAAS